MYDFTIDFNEDEERDFWDAVCFDDLGFYESVMMIKECEMYASDGLEWSMLADMWLDLMQEYGLKNAIRCTNKASEDLTYAPSILAAVRSWLKISEYDNSCMKDACA